MNGEHEIARPTRMLFLGEESLADGFRLIGFEAHADPSPEEAERIVRDLSRTREKAFLVVDNRVMAADIPSLKRVRREGGRIVVVSVPPLAGPMRMSSEVADRLAALYGAAKLQTGQDAGRAAPSERAGGRG